MNQMQSQESFNNHFQNNPMIQQQNMNKQPLPSFQNLTSGVGWSGSTDTPTSSTSIEPNMGMMGMPMVSSSSPMPGNPKSHMSHMDHMGNMDPMGPMNGNSMGPRNNQFHQMGFPGNDMHSNGMMGQHHSLDNPHFQPMSHRQPLPPHHQQQQQQSQQQQQQQQQHHHQQQQPSPQQFYPQNNLNPMNNGFPPRLSQSQQQQMMNSRLGMNGVGGPMMPHQHPHPMQNGGGGGPGHPAGHPSRRPAPYPNPMYMANKRQQNPGMFQSHNMMMGGPGYMRFSGPNNGMYPMGYANMSQNPNAHRPPMMGHFPPNQRQFPQMSMNSHRPMNFNPGGMMGVPGSPDPSFQPQQTTDLPNNNMSPRIMPFQHSPVPGNPTPPLTPNGPSVGVPFASPASSDQGHGSPMDMKPVPMKGMNGGHSGGSGEPRLTFPVKDGLILAPFRLEHSLTVSNFEYVLKPQIFQCLMWRPDLELQLKGFYHEDRGMNVNWPNSVSISVNANPLGIDRSNGPPPHLNPHPNETNKHCHRPLYLKDVCISGRNTIQFTVTACCCSHLFTVQLVHRPTVRSIVQGLLRKRLLPLERGVVKAKTILTNCNNASNNSKDGGNHPSSNPKDTVNGSSSDEPTSLKVMLTCPLTFRRMTLPSRGQDCRHLQCFDLESYLKYNAEKGGNGWKCPVCNKNTPLEALEIDQFTWSILQTPKFSEVDEVMMDQNAGISLSPQIKSEDDRSCSSKRKDKPMAPTSLKLPNLALWEIPSSIRSPGLYTPPDINSIVSGQYPLEESGGPLSQMNEAVNKIDQPRNDPNDPNFLSVKMGPHTPCTPGMPATPHTPGSVGQKASPPCPGSMPSSSSAPNACAPLPSMSTLDGSNGHHMSHPGNDFSLDDLNFDPSSIIGDTDSSDINLGDVDPDDLLSFLDPPPELATPPSSSSGSSCHPGDQQQLSNSSQHGHPGTNHGQCGDSDANQDDLLSLIDNYEYSDK